jgi:phosphate transport system substrate-binding protein
MEQTEGSIGYVEQAYALQNGFTFADVRNRAGRFVSPTLASTSAAGEGIDVPADLGVDIIDSPNPAAYPIASQTFVIMHSDPCRAGMDKGKAQGLKRFVTYLLGPGQETLKKLSYAPVPSGLLSKDKAAVATMTCNGQPLG